VTGRRAASFQAGLQAPQALAREFRRVLRRLAEPGARLMRRGDAKGGFGLCVPKNGYAKPVLHLAAPVVEALIAEALIEPDATDPAGLVITPEGVCFVKRAEAAASPFEAQHRAPGARYIGEPDGRGGAVYAVNLAESPLTWLASRKGSDGRPFLSPPQLLAGERLREDYTRAGLMARVTVDWERPLSGGARGTDRGLTMSESVLAARQRLNAALIAAGDEFEDILITVCCHLARLEEVERAMGWPLRSGKVVLRLGLERLARHYGLIRPRTNPGLRGWSA
jgi:Domain of unknown function (DUF6456)